MSLLGAERDPNQEPGSSPRSRYLEIPEQRGQLRVRPGSTPVRERVLAMAVL